MTKQNKGRKLFAVSASAALVASAIVPVASANAEFTDASSIQAWAKEAVEYFVNEGVINGYDDGSFKPADSVKRGEAAKMFATGLELSSDEESDLTDVSGHWAEEFINAVAAEGIVNGYEDGSFQPEKTLTRAETAKMIVEALGFDEEGDVSAFTDVAGHWAEEYIAIAVGAGILNGVSGTQVAPDADVTREQFATMLYRAFEAAGIIVGIDPTELLEALQAAADEVLAFGDVTAENKEEAQALVDALNAAIEELAALESEDEEVIAALEQAQALAAAAQAKIDALSEITTDHSIRISTKDATVTANGADNTIVTFEILDANGQVDTTANDIVLEIGTSFGNLANNRLTVQNGTASVVLTSEFSANDVTAVVSARVIETVSDKYKELIGQKATEFAVKFTASAVSTDLNTVTLLDAESNQADRVTLYFDKAVTVDAFVETETKTRPDGTQYTQFKTTTVGNETVQVLKADINIIQEGETASRQIKGIKAVAGNAKAVEVLLVKEDALTDNKRITVDAKIGTTTNNKSFILTDARQPEFTSVVPTSLRTADLSFSEAVVNGNFTIDGLWDAADVTGLAKDSAAYNAAIAGKEFAITFGDFNPTTGEDNRHKATLETLEYAEGTEGAVTKAQETATKKANIGKHRYFAAGKHSITVTQLRDFAGLTDGANVSSSQTLTFDILANTAAPTATVTVESPEQFRIKFSTDVEFVLADGETLEAYFAKHFTSSKTGFKLAATDLVVTEVETDEYVVELKQDWTQLLTDGVTDVYYNYTHGFKLPKETITNVANGAINAEIVLSLNESGSPLNGPDNDSPVISDILKGSDDSRYQVVMSEPVKIKGTEKDNAGNSVTTKDNAGDTLAKGQGPLPQVTAEFQGTDKDGKAVVIPAQVGNYLDTDAADKVFEVKTEEAQALQKLVDAGYGENWKVVVRSISDDIGNTASTVTKDFVVKPTVASVSKFQIVSPENKLAEGVIVYDEKGEGKQDRIEVTFTKGVVHTGGISDLTQVNNWTLNGKQLSNVASIVVEDTDNDIKNGYEKVIITFADDAAVTEKNISNVVAVNKNIVSKDGTALTGEFEVVAKTVTTAVIEAKALAKASAEAVVANAVAALAKAEESGDTTAIAAANKALASAKAALAAVQAATDLTELAKAQDEIAKAESEVTKVEEDLAAGNGPKVSVESKSDDFLVEGNTFTYKVVGTETATDLEAYAEFTLTEGGTVTVKEGTEVKVEDKAVTKTDFTKVVKDIAGTNTVADLVGRTFTFTIVNAEGTSSEVYTLKFSSVKQVAELPETAVTFDSATSTATVTLTEADVEALGFNVSELAVYGTQSQLAKFDTFGTDLSATFAADSLEDAKTKIVK